MMRALLARNVALPVIENIHVRAVYESYCIDIDDVKLFINMHSQGRRNRINADARRVNGDSQGRGLHLVND